MRLCGKTPINWFPNQVRSERGSSTRFFCSQFDRLKGPWWSRSATTPASLWRRYPMETLSLRPLCVSMNFMDCTNIPPDPQQGSQRCLYLIQSNDSRNLEHPCVHRKYYLNLWILIHNGRYRKPQENACYRDESVGVFPAAFRQRNWNGHFYKDEWNRAVSNRIPGRPKNNPRYKVQWYFVFYNAGWCVRGLQVQSDDIRKVGMIENINILLSHLL